ncbi:MAG: serine/threonine protein kinase [Clostridia bacterium]|nr:serine/threonine protein kinase [Clostridia bacterium]
MEVWQFLLALGIPSAVFGAFASYLLYRAQKREKEQDDKKRKEEENRHKFELLQIRGTLAAMSLCEACAIALKNGHTNGETERALSYEQDVKHEIRDFLAEQGVNHIS